jgi:hypothetical protein
MPDWPTLLLAAFAVTAFVADGAVGAVLAFIAVLLILDRTLAITGYLASDAPARLRPSGSSTARRRADQAAETPACRGGASPAVRRARIGGPEADAGGPGDRDRVDRGTTEPDKAKDFDRCFRPQWGRGRWQLLWIAHQRGISSPPISVYRVGDRHYVRDGHFRVSVPRSISASSIDAEVVELRTPASKTSAVNSAPPTVPCRSAAHVSPRLSSPSLRTSRSTGDPVTWVCAQTHPHYRPIGGVKAA